MNRTIMQMEVHPELIRLHRERAERNRRLWEMLRPAAQDAMVFGLGCYRIEAISPLDLLSPLTPPWMKP